MSPEQVARLVQQILGGYPTQRQRMSKADIEGMVLSYTAGLCDIDFDDAEEAVRRLSRTSEWIPTIAKICEAVGVVIHGELSTGLQAWEEVHRFIGSKGSWHTPGVDFQFSDNLTHEIVQALGWFAMCASEHEQLANFQSRFIRDYRERSQTERKRTVETPGMDRVPANRTLPERRDAEPLQFASSDERSKMLGEEISKVVAAIGFNPTGKETK